MLPDAPARVRIAPAGSYLGRELQRNPVDREFGRERDARLPDPNGPMGAVQPRTGGFDFLRQLGNVAGSLINNVVQRAAFAPLGAAAPAVAPLLRPIIPVFRPTPPPTIVQIAQPMATADRPTVGQELAEGGSRTLQLEVSRGMADIRGTGTVETISGTREFTFEAPFPEAGFTSEREGAGADLGADTPSVGEAREQVRDQADGFI